MMEIEQFSANQINGLEQQIAQLLKTMRNAKLSHLPIFADLQALEQEIADARRERFDTTDTEYSGY